MKVDLRQQSINKWVDRFMAEGIDFPWLVDTRYPVFYRVGAGFEHVQLLSIKRPDNLKQRKSLCFKGVLS
jgi:hypothetical protein